MKAICNFLHPRYCPNCGESLDLRGTTQNDYWAGRVICPACGLEFEYIAPSPQARPGAEKQIATPTKPYIAGPWYRDRGSIRTPAGWHIANVAYTLGDETDHNTGDLIAAAPDLLEAAIFALAGNITPEAKATLLAAIRRYVPDYQSEAES